MKEDLYDRLGEASQRRHAEMTSLSPDADVPPLKKKKKTLSLNRSECFCFMGTICNKPTWSALRRRRSKISRCSRGMAVLPAPVKTAGLSDGKWQRSLKVGLAGPLPQRQPGTNWWKIRIISLNLSAGVIKPLQASWRWSDAGSSAEKGCGADKDGWWKGPKMAVEDTRGGDSDLFMSLGCESALSQTPVTCARIQRCNLHSAALGSHI